MHIFMSCISSFYFHYPDPRYSRSSLFLIFLFIFTFDKTPSPSMSTSIYAMSTDDLYRHILDLQSNMKRMEAEMEELKKQLRKVEDEADQGPLTVRVSTLEQSFYNMEDYTGILYGSLDKGMSNGLKDTVDNIEHEINELSSHCEILEDTQETKEKELIDKDTQHAKELEELRTQVQTLTIQVNQLQASVSSSSVIHDRENGVRKSSRKRMKSTRYELE